MPRKNIDGKYIVLPNYDHSKTYWPIISSLVHGKIGEREVKEPDEVILILKECFSKLCNIFFNKIGHTKEASFFIFCHYIHEDSIFLWERQLKNDDLNINKEDFAASRRILKIILEQSCKLDLVGTPNFSKEIKDKSEHYCKHLEELLYIGTQCFLISEHIARNQVFPSCIGLKIENSELNILTYQPYTSLYDFIFNEIPKHNSKVVLKKSIEEFKDLLVQSFKIELNNLISFVSQQLSRREYRFGLLKIDTLINEISKKWGYDIKFMKDFYSGLTIAKSNAMSIEDCFLKNQDINRYMYRPILELNIDGEVYNMVGYYKWLESFTTLTTNAFPFGIYPQEWKTYPEIKKFIQQIDHNHDKVLESPIIEILKYKKIKFDCNVESFKQNLGNNINIAQDIGDIDILFLDEKYKIIYVCECKHNRSRFDMNNWKRDYSNFKDKYEDQLTRKVNWVDQNKEIIENHFKVNYGSAFKENISEYDIRGIFIINAPTIYMFNGKFRALTIEDFTNLINDAYTNIIFEFTNEKTLETFRIENPYFDNIMKHLGK